MKKHLAILLAAAMSTTLFAGCGGASQPAASSQGTAASAPQSSASAAPADGTAATDGEILFGLSCARNSYAKNMNVTAARVLWNCGL